MSAALFRRGVARCASRQLYETFVCPPTNHLANGSFHSSTFVNGANQCSSLLASSPQNFSGLALAAAYSSSYFLASISVRLTNSAVGGNLRSSCITVSICPLLMPPPFVEQASPLVQCRPAQNYVSKRGRLLYGESADFSGP